MTTSLEWIAQIAPEIIATNDKKNLFIAMAQDEVSSCLFGNADKYNMAVAYYAAHLLSLAGQDGSSSKGALTMEKEGDLMRSYSNTSSASTGASSTQYLDQYNRLIAVRVPAFYINGNGC